jgi:predicted nucleotidyltransferase
LGICTGLPMAKIFIDSTALAAAASLLLRLGATEVFVFGSATKGGLRPGSDIDMAVRGLPPSVYFSAISKAARTSSAGQLTSWIWTIPHPSFGIFLAAGN